MADMGSSSRDKSGYAGAGQTRGVAGLKEKASEEASTLVTKAKEAASSAVDKTRDVASSIAQKVGDAASTLGHTAAGTVGSVGGGMKSLADTIRDKAPESGILGTAASGVASTLKSGGAYLQELSLQGMMEDVTNLIRRYPLQAILAGLGVGFLVGRISRR